MPLLEQRIEHFLDGISQRPEVQRAATQLAGSKNALSMLALGLAKRPPAQHRGKVDSGSWNFDNAGMHTINRDADEQYRVVVEGGEVKVYDVLDDGSAVSVRDETGDNQAYLTDQGEGFRMATIGDTTIIVNRGVVVEKGTTKAPDAALDDAYITVEQADFSTNYEIELAGNSFEFTTVDQVDAKSRGKITTDYIASSLLSKLEDGPFRFFDFNQFGSTIHISPKKNRDSYEITVRDGLGGNGLHLAKGEVQSFEDLPARAEHGATMKVLGDPSRDTDDFWVEYDAEIAGRTDHGIWKETVGPGVIQDFDETTMPHQLVMEGNLIDEDLEHQDLPNRPSVVQEEDEVKKGGMTELEIAAEPIYDPIYNDGPFLDGPITGDEDIPDTETYILDEHVDDVVERHKARLRREYTSSEDGVDGTERDMKVRYNLDTSLVRTGLDTRVNVAKVDSVGNREILDQRSHPAGEVHQNQEIEINDEVINDGDKVEVELEYGDGFDQQPERRATLQTVGGNKETAIGDVVEWEPPVLELVKGPWIQVTYDNPAGYPVGTDVLLELDGSASFTHTVTGSAETDADVATAMKNLVDAHSSYQATNPSASTVRIRSTTSGAPPVVTDAETSLQPSVFYNDSLDLVSDELVGNDILNLTDGSVGSITANTAKTITASLSGGVDNAFNVGDIVSVEGTDRYFVIKPVDWDLREAGDEDSNPFPSFTGRKITDVFFYRNRIGFTAGENAVLSRSGDLFQFFRTSVVDLLEDDRIDITSAHSEISIFHSAFVWNDELNLWTDSAQFVLGGDQVLTAKTVTLDLVSKFSNHPDVQPAVGGRNLFFVHHQEGSTRVYRYVPETRNTPAQAQDLTRDVPNLLAGRPRDIAVDDGLGVLVVSTAGDPQSIWAYTWTAGQNSLIHAGWNEWRFPTDTEIGKLDAIEGSIGIISEHGSDGVYISDIDLDLPIEPDDNEKGRYLDRRVDSANDSLSPNFDGSDTSWTLPYTPQDPDSVRVFDRDTGTVYDPSVSGNTVTVAGADLSGSNVWIGVIVEMDVDPGILAIRDSSGRGETRGRLQLRNMEVQYHDTTDLDVKVTPQGRPQYTKSLALASPRDGTLRVPLMSENKQTTILLTNTTPGGARISSVTWEGFFNRRSKRV